MKKVLIASLLLVSLSTFAQRGERSHKREMAKNLSAEDAATLQTKKMTLALALDEKQVEKIYPIMLDQAKDRKAQRDARASKEKSVKPTEEEKLKRANDLLDKRIAMQNEMKEILTPTQFEKFQKMNAQKARKGKRLRKKDYEEGRRRQK